MLLRVAGGAAGLAAVVLVFGAWRLSQGPVSLSFLAPHLERSLALAESGFRVSFDDLTFGLGDDGHLLGIRAFGVRARDLDDRVDLRVPETMIGLNVPALARGVVAPHRLDLYRPTVHVRRDDAPADGEVASGAAGTLRRALSDAPGFGGARLVNVVDATVVLRDGESEHRWFLPVGHVSLEPRSIGMTATAAATVESDGEAFEFTATASHDSERGTVAVQARFEDLTPARWARFAPDTMPAGAFDIPLSGEIAFAADLAGRVDTIEFDLSSDAGTIAPPPPYAPGVRLPVSGLRAIGRLEHEPGRLTFDELSIDFDGPSVALEGIVEGDWQRPDIAADIALRGLPIDDLAIYWPRDAAVDARRWALDTLRDGTLETLDMRVEVSGDDRDLARPPADVVAGRFDVSGATVRYRETLPPMHDVRASGRFDGAGATVAIHSGRAGPLDLRNMTMEIRPEPDAAGLVRVEGTFSGEIGETLAMLARPPFDAAGLPSLDPAGVSGTLVGDLTLRVPLDEHALADEIGISVVAEFDDAAFDLGMAGHRGLHDGTGTLFLKRDGFELIGEASVDGVRGSVVWHEAFAPPPDLPRRRIDVSTVLDAAARDRLGVDTPWLHGPIALRAQASAVDGEPTAVDVEVDAVEAAVDLPVLPWLKSPGMPATARSALVLDADGVAAVRGFEIVADAFAASGSATRSDGGPWTVRFDRFAAGATDVSASVVLDETPEIEIHDGLLALREGGIGLEESGRGGAAQPFVLSANVDTLLLGEKLRLGDGVVRLAWNGDTVDRADIDGRLASGASLTLRLRSGAAPGRSAVTAATDDAGQLLRALDVTPNMVGGRLTMDGEIDHRAPSQPLRGVLLIDDFRMVDAPVLTRLLSVVSITGALEMLAGEGLAFERFRAPYAYENGRLTLDDALASALSLGLTMDGTIDFRRNEVDVRGNLVPFYALNTVVNAIPLVGELLTGGEEEGVFAAPYRVTGSRTEPSVAVNPLAIAAPGIFRKLLTEGGLVGGG